MEYADLTYSGEFGFVETSYVYPTTHMVAPKENVVACRECHSRTGIRLANLAGFYMPARDRSAPVDVLGWMLIFGSILGMSLHALGRLFIRGNGRKGD